jgi:hypothetical protein
MRPQPRYAFKKQAQAHMIPNEQPSFPENGPEPRLACIWVADKMLQYIAAWVLKQPVTTLHVTQEG